MNNNEAPNMFEALMASIEAIHGKEWADESRRMFERRAAEPKPFDREAWELDDSVFEPDPYAEVDDFGADAAAADDFFNREF